MDTLFDPLSVDSKMKIKSGKNFIEVNVEELSYTVGELKVQLAEITNFKDLKLIHAGKILRDEDTVGSIPGGLNAELILMGSTSEAIDELKERENNSANKVRVIDDLDGKRPSSMYIDRSEPRQSNQPNPYKFQSIQTLPNLPNEDKAREILNSLANDEGVLAVMKKHKWSVGALCELYPEGYVGVSDVCVMGLNENHGQRILLRLRTDDMKGFRKILSIRKVLCHELAHNVHSEHDVKFYVLMRQIEREIVELDWKNSKGRSLGGQKTEVYAPTLPGASSTPTVYRLGGNTDPLVQQFVPARFLAGTAAIMRISAEEQEVEDNCASGREKAVRGIIPSPRRSNGDGAVMGERGFQQYLSGEGGTGYVHDVHDVDEVHGKRLTDEFGAIDTERGNWHFPHNLISEAHTDINNINNISDGHNNINNNISEAAIEEKEEKEEDDERKESVKADDRDSYSTMKVDVGVDPANPTRSIQSTTDGSIPMVNYSYTGVPTVATEIAATGADIAAMSNGNSKRNNVDFSVVCDAVLANIDETVAFALSMESSAAPVDKLLALRDAISTVLTHIRAQSDLVSADAKLNVFVTCFKVLVQILFNAKVSVFYFTM